jgi:hypothetical protein
LPRLAKARATRSLFSSAIFCASIADWMFPFWTEAPCGDPHTVLVQLLHIHLTFGADAIMLAAVPTPTNLNSTNRLAQGEEESLIGSGVEVAHKFRSP